MLYDIVFRIHRRCILNFNKNAFFRIARISILSVVGKKSERYSVR